jgi:hypothetical protein
MLMKTLVTMLALAVTLTARAEPTPAPDANRKHLTVELQVVGEVTQIVDVRMDYSPAAATPPSQDIFFIEGLDQRRRPVTRVALPNPLELRVYNEPEILLAPIGPGIEPVPRSRPPAEGEFPIVPRRPVSNPHRVETLQEVTFKVAIPFHFTLTTLRTGFTGGKEVVMYDARTVIRDFCGKTKGDGECSEWLAANRARE